jgi:hypothetical protein
MQWYKDNSDFIKEKLASFVEATTPHKESSLMGVEVGGPSTCPRFRCLETTTKNLSKTCWFHNYCSFIPTYIFHDAF